KIIDDDDNGGNYIIFEKPNISPDVFSNNSKIYVLTAENELILQELEASVISFFTRHHVNWIKNHPLQLLFHTVFKLESCHKIQQLCLDNICNDPDIVFNSSISKSINESILLQLLKRDDLRMNEIKLLDYLIQWGVTNLDINCNDGNVVDSVSNWTQNEFDALDSILKNCIGNIRFENINRNELKSIGQLKNFEKFLEKYFLQNEENLIDSNIINLNHAILISDWIDQKDIKYNDNNNTTVYDKYIYIGKISLEKLDPIFTLDILTAANELILQELEASVISFFTRHHVNWIKNHPLQLLFHTVFKLESCHKIQQLCLDNICNDPDIVFNSSISKSINESILLQLLKRDDLRMNEIKLLDYLIQWGVTNLDINCNDGNVVDSVSNWTQNEFDALDSILKNCIGNIRFENINRNELKSIGQLKNFEKFLEKYFLQNEENLIDSNIINLNHAILISDWIDQKDIKYNDNNNTTVYGVITHQ
ncbi:12418_t:CDS:2, partial [Entrophospora sp. SA101]